jgi:HK97 gp10 family phage protein
VKVSLTVSGLPQALKALSQFEQTLSNKVLRKSVRDGAKWLQKLAVANTPLGKTGTLRKSIVVRAGRKRRKNVFGIYVRIYGGSKTFGEKAFYGSFVELGSIHNPRPAHMLTDAFKHGKEHALEIVRDSIRNYVSLLSTGSTETL